MRKTTVPQRVQAFLDKNPKPAQIIAEDMKDIYSLGDTFDIINTAFYYGYMRGIRAKKGGAKV